MIVHCRRWRAVALGVALAACMAGCSGPTATLELITVARKGLVMAREDQQARHAEELAALARQTAALDAAFDADVKLVAAGQIADANGRPLELSPDWIISARKGYAAARNLLAEQARRAEATHRIQQDNLQAADKALEMASQLVVWQSNLSQRLKEHLLGAQRSLVNE